MYCTSSARVLRALLTISIFTAVLPESYPQPSNLTAAIRANDNRRAAGKLENGVLTLHLEITEGNWYPEADDGPSMKVDAFAEQGQAPQVPGPLVRVPQGTEIRVSFHNLLPKTAVIYGIHKHPGEVKDTIEVPTGETREKRFFAGEPGTYQYFASAGGEMNRGRPFRDDSQLHGAFIVDPPGKIEPDRVFVIGIWRSERTPTLSQDVAVINGKSWPYTERLEYKPGEQARWRWINASDVNHPMHMHGSYFQVTSVGDGERDRILSGDDQLTVATQLMPPSSTMNAVWSAVPGRWVFHCHLMAHVAPNRTVANAYATAAETAHDHGSNHMAGLVMGITVSGERPKVAAQGGTRKLRLVVQERPPMNGLPAGFQYQWEESHRPSPGDAVPGAPLVLERGRPVEITVVNQLSEPTAVHWHGIELESYYDGVAGWGMRGREVTPMIEPGQSFCARFTPPRAGTFMYHTHLNDEAQLAAGLYGPLIVTEPGTRFDSTRDQIFTISAWGGPRSGHEEKPLSFLINGNGQPPMVHWRVGEHYRLRLINITSSMVGIASLFATGAHGKWSPWAKDGADLPSSQRAPKGAVQMIAPGETYDFEYDARERGKLTLEFKGVAVPATVSQLIQVE